MSLRLASDAEQLLLSQLWPGNVRELRQVLQRRARDLAVLPHPSEARITTHSARIQEAKGDGRERIIAAMVRSAGNVSEAARQLEMSKSTLFDKLRHYGLKKPRS
jgi:transcriptional regulator of acetoin/glycerol metabolism